MRITGKSAILIIFGLFIFKIAVADTFRSPDRQNIDFSGDSVVVHK